MIPRDPYLTKRQQAAEIKSYKTKTDFDKLKQYVEMDRKVLRFYAIWDDRSQMFGEQREFVIQYYLVNDTMEVREVHKANDGRDPFPVLITRHRIPKDRYDIKGSFCFFNDKNFLLIVVFNINFSDFSSRLPRIN